MKLPRRTFLHLAAGAAALPALSRIARAQAYPARPVRIIVGFARRRRSRHHRAPDRPMAVGAARAAIHHREPAGRRRQYRHRSGRARASRRLHAALGRRVGNAINATLYDKLNFNFIRDIAPVAGIMRVPSVMVVNPSVPAKTIPEFIAYAKANPGKITMASPGTGSWPPHCGRAVQDDGRRRHGARAVSRRWASPHRSARRASAGDVCLHAVLGRIHQDRQAACARGAPPRRARRRCRTSRPWANSCRATRRAVGSGSARPRTRPPKSSTSSTRKSTRPSPIPR